MIHKKLVQEKIKDYQIQNFVKESLKGVGLSSTKLQVTPLGEKIIVRAARPGLVVGRKGQSIKKLTNMLKKKFGLENPQIEIDEVKDTKQDPAIMAETIASYLERFGSARFKSIGHRCLEDAMKDGAYGAEILITGKVPSSRSKSWRFYKGYLKKCGELSISGVRKAYATAHLKTGSIGIQVRVMPSDIRLPDKVEILDQPITEIEDVTQSQKVDETPVSETKEEDDRPVQKDKEKTEKTSTKKSTKKTTKKTAKKSTKKATKKTTKKSTSTNQK
ncbi:MAG: 30S ribosomal protein S3 [Nanoarchaeota archaeon]